MTWRERLLDAAYVSPSGNRFPFLYTDVSREFTKKTSAFNFPDADGTYIQDFGKTGKRYPLRIYFSGDDCDLQATAFEDALGERGTGILEHPLYGAINVVPFGGIRRQDKLVSEANISMISVTFYETINKIYPQDQTDAPAEIASKINDAVPIKSEEFANETDLESVVNQANATGEYETLLDEVKSGLQTVASATKEVETQFNNIYDSINLGIDILIGEPLTLAAQTQLLIQSPARAAALITDRLDAYGNLLNTIIGKEDETDQNTFLINELYGQTYVLSECLSVLTGNFLTKSEAVSAAEVITTAFDDFIAWRDDNFASTGLLDTGEAYQQLQDIVSQTEGYLITTSFTLLQERILILDRAKTVIDLSYELYPLREDRIDFLINSNDLTGSQILELEKGTEILYYV